MSNNADKQQQLLDRADVRVKHEAGIGGAISAFLDRVRSGDLGALPVVVGLVVIWTVFATLNPIFLSSTNLVNLLFDSSTVGVIALGVVLMLMVGEIDLSIGSVSGFASALLGVLWVNHGWPVPLAILGGTGSINLPYGSPLVDFGQLLTMPQPVAYGLAALPGIAMFVTGYRTAARRREAGLSSKSLGGVIFFAVVVTLGLELAVAYLNTSRGVPWMFALFVLLVVGMNYALTRTQWGRSMTAVGGNREAARRAGINVKAIYTSAFVFCAMFAALGGMLAASRLASASQQAGTGDVNLNAIAAAVIGGTSLFGGRGSAYSALLGIIVIQSIANGLTLLDLSSSLRYMITGGVLAVAVIVDSLARRSRVMHGRA